MVSECLTLQDVVYTWKRAVPNRDAKPAQSKNYRFEFGAFMILGFGFPVQRSSEVRDHESAGEAHVTVSLILGKFVKCR